MLSFTAAGAEGIAAAAVHSAGKPRDNSIHVIAIWVSVVRYVADGSLIIASVLGGKAARRQLDSSRGKPRAREADVLADQFDCSSHVLLHLGALHDQPGSVHALLE